MYSKELTIEEVYAVHGKVEHKYISKLKFNSKQFTKVSSTGWDGLEPVTADFSINYLNLGKILTSQPNWTGHQLIPIDLGNLALWISLCEISWKSCKVMLEPFSSKLEVLEMPFNNMQTIQIGSGWFSSRCKPRPRKKLVNHFHFVIFSIKLFQFGVFGSFMELFDWSKVRLSF